MGGFQLKDLGGPVISQVQLQLIFWGTSWGEPGNQVSNIVSQTASLMSTRYFSGLTEYRGIGYGSVNPNYILANEANAGYPLPQPNFTQDDVQTLLLYVQDYLVTATPNVLFVVIPDQSSTMIMDSTAYHWSFQEAGTPIVQYACLCQGITQWIEAFSTSLSHEIVEACTDPQLPLGSPAIVLENDSVLPNLRKEICDSSNLLADVGGAGGGIWATAYFSNRLNKYVAFGDYWINPYSLGSFTLAGAVSALVGNFRGGPIDLFLSVGTNENTAFCAWEDSGYAQANLSHLPGSLVVTPGIWLKGDFNGSGLDDLVFIPTAPGHLGRFARWGPIQVHLQLLGVGFQTVTYSPFGAGSAIPQGTWLVGDFNGDGKDDLLLLVVTDAGDMTSYTFLSNGDGTFNKVQQNWEETWSVAEFLVLDINNDGKDDLFIVPTNAIAVPWAGISNGDGTFTANAVGLPGLPMSGTWLVGDFNGDSILDLAQIIGTGPFQKNMVIWLSNGDGTFNTVDNTPTAQQDNLLLSGQWFAGDFNGDGKCDLAHLVNPGANGPLGYIVTWISNGDGTLNPRRYNAPSGYAIPNGTWVVGILYDGTASLINVFQGGAQIDVWISQLGTEIAGQQVVNGAFQNTTEGPGP